MSKSAFFFVISFITLNILAVEDQCARPGEVLSKDFVGIFSQWNSSESKQRLPKVDPISTFQASFTTTTKTYKHFKLSKCVKDFTIVDEDVCSKIDASTALGEGNKLFKSFFSYDVSLEERATLMVSTLSFANSLVVAERILLAADIILYSNEWASINGIPTGIRSYSEMLDSLIDAGISPEYTEELKKKSNVKTLGLVKLEGVSVKEGELKPEFKDLFNTTISLTNRVTLMENFFDGLLLNTLEKKLELATYLAAYANFNGAPTNWSEIVNMFTILNNNGQLSTEAFIRVTQTLEEQNRKNLGLDLQATVCNTIQVEKEYNRVDVKTVKEFHQDITEQFTLSVDESILLENETEQFSVKTTGLGEFDPVVRSSHNSYSYEKSGEKGQYQIKLKATRKRINPTNTFKVKLKRFPGKNYIISLLDQFKYQQFIKGAVVKATLFHERTLWFDRELGDFTINYTHGDQPFEYDTKVKDLGPGVNVYILFRVYKDSDLHTSGASREYRQDL